MSCMLVPTQGGASEIFPIDAGGLNALQSQGTNAILSALHAAGFIPSLFLPANMQVRMGAGLRPDRSAIYMVTLVPDPSPAVTSPWHGAFFSPFGIGEIVGTISGHPDGGSLLTITVAAKLNVGGSEQVAAEWSVLGSADVQRNGAALIQSINISNPGPHYQDDIRRCIALHAPQRAFGDPGAITAMQCGVAAAALIEAIC